MGWRGVSYRPVCPLYGEGVKEGLRSWAGAGALPAGAGME